ncbi:MAG TPA: EMC3/TMCO1 family protein [Thermoplasmata archaeon]
MASGGASGQSAPRANMSNQLIMLFMFIIALFVMFDNDLRQGLGRAVGVALEPLVGFDYTVPVITLFLAGLILGSLSTTLRHFFMDWIGQARSARIMSAFQKELKEAKTSNNTYKLKKLQEMQPQMMANQLQNSQAQFKVMPLTLLVVIPIFAWLATFVGAVSFDVFTVPWSFNVDMQGSTVLPHWILLYSLLTIPFGQVISRTLKYFSFSRRLKALEGGSETAAEDIEDKGK